MWYVKRGNFFLPTWTVKRENVSYASVMMLAFLSNLVVIVSYWVIVFQSFHLIKIPFLHEFEVCLHLFILIVFLEYKSIVYECNDPHNTGQLFLERLLKYLLLTCPPKSINVKNVVYILRRIQQRIPIIHLVNTAAFNWLN